MKRITEYTIKTLNEVKRNWIRLSRKKQALIISLTILLIIAAVIGTYGLYCLNQVKTEKPSDVVIVEETFDDDSEQLETEALEEEDDVLTWEDYGYDRSTMDGVINILLCGEENIAESQYDQRGRTDCIMIATINNNEGTLKLTSVMRDMYVKIPGYSNNKLNASYRIGGMPLLQQTLEENFGIAIDGYALVDFDGFKNIIDLLGGVDIELTEEEAAYLNKTNYIDEKQYRNVVAGLNHMNGSQALGYSRVRYVATGTGLRDDFGRNYRQRTVLMQIFEQYKSIGVTELLNLVPNVLKLITTDISKTQLIEYAAAVLTLGATEIETYRLPVEGTYKNARINNMAVLYITDMDKLRSTFKEYVFGNVIDETKLTQTSDIVVQPSTSSGASSVNSTTTAKPTATLAPTTTPTPVENNESEVTESATVTSPATPTPTPEPVIIVTEAPTPTPTPIVTDILDTTDGSDEEVAVHPEQDSSISTEITIDTEIIPDSSIEDNEVVSTPENNINPSNEVIISDDVIVSN